MIDRTTKSSAASSAIAAGGDASRTTRGAKAACRVRRHAFAAACVLWAILFAVVMFVDVLPFLAATLEYTPSGLR